MKEREELSFLVAPSSPPSPESGEGSASFPSLDPAEMLGAIYNALALIYNLLLEQGESAKPVKPIWTPQPRQSLTAGQSATFYTTDPDTDWLISIEQSTSAVALTVFNTGSGVLAVLGASDTFRFPATTDVLVVKNTGTNTVAFSIWETNE